ncbi:tetratricopeptide repeat protein [Microcoleus sp. AT9_B5]
MKAVKLEIGVLRPEAAGQEAGGKRKKEGARRSVFTNMRCSQNQAKLKQWASHAPMNHLHKWQLVEAELYRVLGEYKEAIECYEFAIKGAKQNGFLQDKAIAKVCDGKTINKKTHGTIVCKHSIWRKRRAAFSLNLSPREP